MSQELITAQIERIYPLTDSIMELVLTPECYIPYQAGQYLQIRSGQEFLSYSIANAPLGSHRYELHIRHDPHNLANQALFAEIREQGVVHIRLPFGDCHLDKLEDNIPILFISAGTGFAPVNAMIEQLLATGDERTFELYWAARSQSDLYLDDRIRQWASHVSHFGYFSLLSNSESKETLATRVLHQHKRDLQEYQIVLAGPFDMVFAVRDTLVQAGLAESRMYSDAFHFYEKRS